MRWFQRGAFGPLFRLHGDRSGPHWPPGDAGACSATASNEVWSFGNESAAAIVKAMRMRASSCGRTSVRALAQYEEAAASGTPIIRPLVFDFWEAAGAAAVDDQQMLGPDYQVAPVLAAPRRAPSTCKRLGRPRCVGERLHGRADGQAFML